MTRHLILVGLPGCGKTTVGRPLAKLLSTDFTDLDELVEAEAGHSISAVFDRMGEPEFRRFERAGMDRVLAGPPRLIAAGGGWMAEPGNLASAREQGAWIVYLRVSPEVAAARLGAAAGRPLLAGGDPATRLRDLLAARESCYLQADAQVEAAGDPATVVALIMQAWEKRVPS